MKFFLKTDDDMFINVPNLIQVLLGGTIPNYKAVKTLYSATSQESQLNNKKLLLMGYIREGLKKHTNPRSKWYIPDNYYAPKYLPSYLDGTGYVMSNETARFLYGEIFNTKILYLEDVYLTGIVAKKVGIEKISHPSMTLWFYTPNNKCSLLSLIAQHQLSTSDMHEAFNFITTKSMEERNCAKI